MLACVEGNVVLPFQSNYYSTEDEVNFGNLKPYYRLNETIVVEYTLGQKVRASSHDVVGMYPLGWQSLEQFIAFETAIVRPAETHRRQRRLVFQPRYRVDRVQPGVQYMFLYVTTDSLQVLGTSSTFRFMPEMSPENQAENWQGCDEKQLKTGRPLRKSHDAGHSLPLLMDNVPIMPQYSSCTMTPQWIRPGPRHNMVTPSSLVPVCMHCKCPANYARTQQNLHAKVRAVTDELHEEQARVAALERQLELSHVAQSKLRLSAEYALREKTAALACVNSVIASLSERGMWKLANFQGAAGPDHRQRYCPSPQVAPKVVQHMPDAVTPNSVPLPPPGLLTSRERHLKAIIGSQESTIRDLVRRLAAADPNFKVVKEPEAQKPKSRADRRSESSARPPEAAQRGQSTKSSEKNPREAPQKAEISTQVDTVQSVIIHAEEAQFGDREVLPESDDSDSNESRCSTLSEGVSSPK